MFEEAGLSSKRAPATWDELYAYSKKLVRYDGDKITVNPINELTQGATGQPTINWLYSGGGSFISNDKRRVEFGSAKAIQMVEWVEKFRTSMFKNPGVDDKLGTGDFLKGTSAMMLLGSEGFSFVWEDNPNFPLGVGPRPKLDGSQFIGANSGTWTYAIPASVPNKEAAWELLKWLTVRQESAGWFIREQGRPSPIVKFNRHPDYLKVNPLMPVLGDVLAQVASFPMLPIHNDMVTQYRDAFRKVMKGEAPAQSVLPEAAVRAQNLLDAYWADHDKKK
jgi:ABC-type glycerol-3-phosphate transport system substrate-binding protein